MAARPLGKWLLGALGAVAAVVAIDSSGVISDDASVVVDNAAQLTAGLLATGCCWWSSRRVVGLERNWRRLMALGMGGWSVGMALWAWYQVFSDTPLPSPSMADVGFLTLPVFALPALLTFVGEPRQSLFGTRSSPRTSLVFLLDGLIVVGSLFILTWSTALGSVVDAGAPNTLAFAVAIAYPVTDLVLVVIVGLLAVTQRVAQQHRAQVWLLGWGLVGLSVSDSIFAYLVSSGADEMPPVTNTGFVAGPVLIAFAGLATARQVPDFGLRRAHWPVDRAHLFLPYVLVAVTGGAVAIQVARGRDVDRVEAGIAWLVLGLVLVRQIITLLENTALLERVTATQQELAHRAQHDPLTGLANRTLFSERLHHAMHYHRHHGLPFALLLVDLDDFKVVNDNLGHAVGDRLLHAVADRLRGCVRGVDTVARFGGDEFAVVLEGMAEAPEAVGERILASLRQPFAVNGRQLTLSASVGVVEPGENEVNLTADALLRRADGAMYEGKRRGKGVAVRYVPGLMPEMPSA